jgi:hypothetical protein
VTSERLVQTSGRLLHVVSQGGELRYLYHENGVYFREGGRKVLSGELDPELRFRIMGEVTLLAKRDQVFQLNSDGSTDRFSTGLYRHLLPVFDANGHETYWLQGDQLVTHGTYGPKPIGNVLSDQTLFWVGESFGLGFFQAGKIVRSFLFDVHSGNFNDQGEIPSLPGQVVDTTTVFGTDRAWFFATVKEQGTVYHKCYVVSKQGKLMAEASATDGEDSWLGAGIRGHLAVGPALCVATDEGIVRLGVSGLSIVEEKLFPDTEPFVNSHTQLVAGRDGIIAVLHGEIVLLKIK